MAPTNVSSQQLRQRHVPPLQPTRHMQFNFQSTVTVLTSAHTLALNFDRNAMLRGTRSLHEEYVLQHSHGSSRAMSFHIPSPTALNPVVDTLFAAVTSSLNVRLAHGLLQPMLPS
ncbi:hypothetical protein BDR03DRAFT_1054825 [Suillus americanus]|nr:hypothetical protein BDR03DRAFT_1054825 [Suillus americanus]